MKGTNVSCVHRGADQEQQRSSDLMIGRHMLRQEQQQGSDSIGTKMLAHCVDKVVAQERQEDSSVLMNQQMLAHY